MFGHLIRTHTKVAEYILPDGNGSYSLDVPKGRGYDFKAFVDGSQNGYPTTGEVWKHYLDWNSTLGGFNLLQVDGNMSGINLVYGIRMLIMMAF